MDKDNKIFFSRYIVKSFKEKIDAKAPTDIVNYIKNMFKDDINKAMDYYIFGTKGGDIGITNKDIKDIDTADVVDYMTIGELMALIIPAWMWLVKKKQDSIDRLKSVDVVARDTYPSEFIHKLTIDEFNNMTKDVLISKENMSRGISDTIDNIYKDCGGYIPINLIDLRVLDRGKVVGHLCEFGRHLNLDKEELPYMKAYIPLKEVIKDLLQ